MFLQPLTIIVITLLTYSTVFEIMKEDTLVNMTSTQSLIKTLKKGKLSNKLLDNIMVIYFINRLHNTYLL